VTNRCALVGVGSRSFSWLNAIVKTHGDRNQLVALCDPHASRCRNANKMLGADAAVYDDYDRMLAEARPDLVVVTSPDALHAEHVVKALDAGCQVAAEKPLCTVGADAQAILEAQRRSDAPLTMAFNYRHVPLNLAIKELIADGRIGRPVSVDLAWYLDYRGHGASYFRRWHRLMDVSGGLLITKASHHFDLVNWFVADRPATVYAQCALNFFGAGKGKFQGKRCRDCPHADECEFFYDISDRRRRTRELGYEVADSDELAGDVCPFSDDVTIYDTMSLLVGYRGGCLLNYSLNASVPFEGWRLAINGTGGRLETGITDAKPTQGWQKRHKIVTRDGHRVLPTDEYYVVDWPDTYTIHVMPHDANAFEVSVPNVVAGHGGGDAKIFALALCGERPAEDPLSTFATALDGAMSMAIGAGANLSAETGRPVEIREVLGDWADA